MKLLLFDIDGTLIQSGQAGLRGLNRAFQKLYGYADILEGIPLAGRTDDKIMMDAYAKAGMDFSYVELKQFKSVYYNFLAEEMQNGSAPKRTMPGITELIPKLAQQNHVCLALLTGNWERSGRLKIDYFGLNSYFAFGAFSDDSPIRSDLTPIAMHRFKNKYGINVEPHDVYVIGDTPSDILCAKPHGVVSVAVAAASYSIENLRSYEPDILLADLSDIDAVLKILT
jgi:phosphoglycolate phosphatase-like HAD superfamily hydrolase